MNSKYKNFIAVGLASIVIASGLSISPDASAITMIQPSPPSMVATNVALNSSRNAANVAITAANKNKTDKTQISTPLGIFLILGVSLLAVLPTAGLMLKDDPKFRKKMKDKISKIRNKSLPKDNFSAINKLIGE